MIAGKRVNRWMLGRESRLTPAQNPEVNISFLLLGRNYLPEYDIALFDVA